MQAPPLLDLNPAAPSALYSFTHRVRWRIYGFLFTFGFIAYFQQKGLTVAAERIMPDLHFSQVQIGWLESAFVLGYALFQFPGGILGQRLGARRLFTIIGAVAFLATVLTPLAPALLRGELLLFAMLALQFILGLAQGPIFPLSTGVMESWFAPQKWALIQGLQSSALQLAAAAAAPLVAYLMSTIGWQQALLWPALPAAGVVALWAWYGRNTPQQHPAVSAAEIAELGSRPEEPAQSAITRARLVRIVTNRSVMLLSVSYVCMNYVFYLISNWCFLYLIQERHFNVLESGLLSMLPPLGAAVGAGVGGVLVARACKRFGMRWGYRAVPLFALPAAGLLLLVVVNLANAYLALAALTLAYLVVELTEAAYWGGVMVVARADCMSASGVLNTGGNLGGIIGIPIVAHLSGGGHWTAAFAFGTLFALIGTILWFGIDAGKPIASLPDER
jgi:ACS family glucarate transporter-like MFS transporter